MQRISKAYFNNYISVNSLYVNCKTTLAYEKKIFIEKLPLKLAKNTMGSLFNVTLSWTKLHKIVIYHIRKSQEFRPNPVKIQTALISKISMRFNFFPKWFWLCSIFNALSFFSPNYLIFLKVCCNRTNILCSCIL